jgi:hypothetical protein
LRIARVEDQRVKAELRTTETGQRIVLTLIHINAANGKQVDEILEEELRFRGERDATGGLSHFTQEEAAIFRSSVPEETERPSLQELERARELNAAMLVMGACAHSKIGDFAFAGTTRPRFSRRRASTHAVAERPAKLSSPK